LPLRTAGGPSAAMDPIAPQHPAPSIHVEPLAFDQVIERRAEQLAVLDVPALIAELTRRAGTVRLTCSNLPLNPPAASN
jgi:hypothetical protein